jgi:predicted dehydrogenase
MSFDPVNVGVIGLGRFGRLHSLTLNGLAEANLVGVVARRQASLDAIADELPDTPGWLDLDQAIEESGAEAWVVACTTASHVEVTRKLLQAGHRVLLEKPISEDLADAKSLSPLVNADSSNLMIGHILLFNSEFLALQDEAQTQGPISYINCVRHRPADIVTNSTASNCENPLHAAMVHDLYSVQVLLNRTEPSEFSCQYHRTPNGIIDLALGQLKWAHGPVASFAASYLTPSGMPPRGFDRTEVFGEGWSARIEANPRPIQVWDTQASWPMALEIRADKNCATGMMAEELRCFCRVVRGTQSVPLGATYTDAIQVQEWMEKLAQSAT